LNGMTNAVRPDGVPVEARGFQLAGGTAALLAWIPTHPPGTSAAAAPAGNAPDLRRTRLEVRWPCPRGLARLRNERGLLLGTAPLAPDGPTARSTIDLTAGTVIVATVDDCGPT
jgi:hypothetical protein